MRAGLLISVRFVFLVHSKTIYLYHEYIQEKLLSFVRFMRYKLILFPISSKIFCFCQIVLRPISDGV